MEVMKEYCDGKEERWTLRGSRKDALGGTNVWSGNCHRWLWLAMIPADPAE